MQKSYFLKVASYFFMENKSQIYFMFFWVYRRNKQKKHKYFRFLGFDDMLLTFSIKDLLNFTRLLNTVTIKNLNVKR